MGRDLRFHINGRCYGVGELVSLRSVRELAAIRTFLRAVNAAEVDALRALMRIGVQSDAEVTDGEGARGQIVSQAYCSALPVSYTGEPVIRWQPFADLLLEAAYETTLWAALKWHTQRLKTSYYWHVSVEVLLVTVTPGLMRRCGVP